MARISEKNPLFRTKETICADVSHVLNDPALHFCAKFAVVDQAIWVWSEYEGKYKGCKLWSEEAMRGDPKNGALVHEHSVPRKQIRSLLFGLECATAQSVWAVMDRYCVGVVVSKREDLLLVKAGLSSRMPDDWDGINIFARYDAVGIRVIENPATGRSALDPVIAES